MNEKRETERRVIKYRGVNLERVRAYEYLGSVITEHGKIDVELANEVRNKTQIYSMKLTTLGKKEIDKAVNLVV